MSNTTLSFTNSIPEHYEELLGPFLFEPYALELAARIRETPAREVLELACGTGRLTRRIAGELGAGARLTATDINAGMLAVARDKITDPRIRWAEADMGALPFPDESFDLVVSQFGLMFATDKAAMLREIRRVLRKGGRLVFNTWAPVAENPVWMQLGQMMRQVFGDGLSNQTEGPFSMSDEGQVLQLMEDNGFAGVAARRVELMGSIESAAQAAKGMIEGLPVINLIRDKAPGALPGMLDRLETRYVAIFGDHPMEARLSALVFEGRVAS